MLLLLLLLLLPAAWCLSAWPALPCAWHMLAGKTACAPRPPPPHTHTTPSPSQDIVAESHAFDFAAFIPTLEDDVTVTHPFKRQFLLGWLRCACVRPRPLHPTLPTHGAPPPPPHPPACLHSPTHTPLSSLLDSIPEVELAAHLPELLPGLLPMLSDANSEIRSQAAKLLQVRGVVWAEGAKGRRGAGRGTGRRPRPARGAPSGAH